MLTTTQKHTVRIFLTILSAGFIVHSVLGFYALLSSEPRFRIRPRHIGEVEVRGQTYHLHKTRPVDMKHRTILEKRRRTAGRTHLSARRNILAHQIAGERSLNYHRVGGVTDGIGLSCQTCALIGYSAHLLNSRYGHDIDKMDCIFRMGLSPVKGFEDNVGSRTTLRVLDGKSFNLLVKRPIKLVTGTQSSPKWIIHDHKDLDGVIKIQMKLPEIRRQYPNITVYTVTRSGENAALSSLWKEGGKLGYKMLSVQPSTLWYTIQAVSSASCAEMKIYGVLHAKHCKLSDSDHRIRLNYWDRYSSLSCSDGADSGLQVEAGDHAISLNDRRALLSWSQNRTVSFIAPQWPQT